MELEFFQDVGGMWQHCSTNALYDSMKKKKHKNYLYNKILNIESNFFLFSNLLMGFHRALRFPSIFSNYFE